MTAITRRWLPALVFAGAVSIGVAGAGPALALTVTELAQQIAASPSLEMVLADIEAAKLQGMSPTEIAQAFGQALRLAELAEASAEAKASILASFESFKSSPGFDVAVLDAAFSVGAGRSIAAFTGGAGGEGGAAAASSYLGASTPAQPANDNPSPH